MITSVLFLWRLFTFDCCGHLKRNLKQRNTLQNVSGNICGSFSDGTGTKGKVYSMGFLN